MNNNNNNIHQVGTNTATALPKNPYHKKVTLFPTPTGHHHQKKDRAFLPDQGTTGVACDLHTSVEVYSAHGDALYTIPTADVVSFPAGFKPNEVNRKIHLCPYFVASSSVQNGNEQVVDANVSNNNNTSCPHGADCEHIHASLHRATAHDIHVNYAWRNLADVKYPRFGAGEAFQVAPPNESLVLDVVPSHLVLKTKAFDGHNNNNNGKRVISHCAHYYYNRICNRGTRCCFVHAVSFASLPSSSASSTTTTCSHHHHNSKKPAFVSDIPEAERQSYGRTQPIREFPTLAAAQQAIRDRDNKTSSASSSSMFQGKPKGSSTSAAATSTSSTTTASVVVGSPLQNQTNKVMKPPQQQQQQLPSVSVTPINISVSNTTPVSTPIMFKSSSSSSKFVQAFTSNIVVGHNRQHSLSSNSVTPNNGMKFIGGYSNAPSTPPNTLSTGSDHSSANSEAGEDDANHMLVDDDPSAMMMAEQQLIHQQKQQGNTSPSSAVAVKKRPTRKIHNPYAWSPNKVIVA